MQRTDERIEQDSPQMWTDTSKKRFGVQERSSGSESPSTAIEHFPYGSGNSQADNEAGPLALELPQSIDRRECVQ